MTASDQISKRYIKKANMKLAEDIRCEEIYKEASAYGIERAQLDAYATFVLKYGEVPSRSEALNIAFLHKLRELGATD